MQKPGASPQGNAGSRTSAEGAIFFRVADKLYWQFTVLLSLLLCRAFSAFYLRLTVLGRCPRLLHFAPLALR